jgi:hypothetical protein
MHHEQPAAQDHSQMHHEQPAKKQAKAKKKMPVHHARSISHENMPGMDHGAEHSGHQMKGFLGPYGIGREGSGTSWQPDNSPHEGIHAQYGEWMTMWNALFNGVYDNQGGPRGDTKSFVSGMAMAMAERQVDANTFGLRAMLSPDPFMGASGYPLLLATGETADGRTPLIDRQHPHDLFMNWLRPIRTNSPRHPAYTFTRGCPVILPLALPRLCTGLADWIILRRRSPIIGWTALTLLMGSSRQGSFSTPSSSRLLPFVVASRTNIGST